MRENIRRRYHGGNNHHDNDSMTPVMPQKWRRNQPHFCQKKRQNRHFENQPENENEHRYELQILIHRNRRYHVGGLESEQKPQTKPQNNEITEQGATEKTNRRKENYQREILFFFLQKPWHDKLPELVKYNRKCYQETHEDRKLDSDHKSPGGCQKNQLLRFWLAKISNCLVIGPGQNV